MDLTRRGRNGQPHFLTCFRINVCPRLESSDTIESHKHFPSSVTTITVRTETFTIHIGAIRQRLFSAGTSDHGFSGMSLVSSVSH